MKISKAKERALQAAVVEVFGPRFKALEQTHAAIADAAWEELYGKHKAALEKVPKNMLNTSGAIGWMGRDGYLYEATFGGHLPDRGSYRDKEMEFHRFLATKGESVRKPVAKTRLDQFGSASLGKRYKALWSKFDALRDEINAFCETMRANFSRVKNPKQLKAAWPDVDRFLPDDWDAAPVPMVLEKGFLGKLVKQAKSA